MGRIQVPLYRVAGALHAHTFLLGESGMPVGNW
jgi:hypothetical protein